MWCSLCWSQDVGLAELTKTSGAFRIGLTTSNAKTWQCLNIVGYGLWIFVDRYGLWDVDEDVWISLDDRILGLFDLFKSMVKIWIIAGIRWLNLTTFGSNFAIGYNETSCVPSWMKVASPGVGLPPFHRSFRSKKVQVWVWQADDHDWPSCDALDEWVYNYNNSSSGWCYPLVN